MKIPKEFGTLVFAAAIIATIAWGFWSFVYSTWRYRMTIVIETPEGDKTGSAVRQVSEIRNLSHMSDVSVKGEAVVVDLGNRGIVFAVMRGGIGNPDYADLRSVGLDITHLKTKVSLTPSQYPILVRFKKLKDPKSIEQIVEMERIGRGYPIRLGIKADHFEEMFGKGVHLKEITVEPTSDSVTWGIEKWIPWLPERKGVPGSFGGTPRRGDPPYYGVLGFNGIEFSKGQYW